MCALDTMTLQRIADLIVDIDGPFERRGYELAQLLQRAGWPAEAEYDGSARIQWLTEAMTDSRIDQAAISRLICRVCDPLEYQDGAASAEAVRTEVNRILAAERLTVSVAAGRPVLAAPSSDGGPTNFALPDDLEARLRPLVSGEAVLTQLMQRIQETRICERHGAYVFALVGIGSFTEGLLHDVALRRDPSLSKGFLENGKRVPADRVSFATLVNFAQQRGWIQTDAHDFMKIVRDYRNFVHLRHQQERGIEPDADTVMMCWGPVLAILNDLEMFDDTN